jgi:hypothetical protein
LDAFGPIDFALMHQILTLSKLGDPKNQNLLQAQNRNQPKQKTKRETTKNKAK